MFKLKALVSTNINQSAPDLVKMYVTRSWMYLVMDLIRPVQLESCALEFEKNCHICICFHSSICKYKPFSTKHSHNVI